MRNHSEYLGKASQDKTEYQLTHHYLLQSCSQPLQDLQEQHCQGSDCDEDVNESDRHHISLDVLGPRPCQEKPHPNKVSRAVGEASGFWHVSKVKEGDPCEAGQDLERRITVVDLP